MSLVCSALVAALAVLPLRVCADPNNLPYSNATGSGFENKIAEFVAHELGRPLSYLWRPQRRGFVRETLAAHRCDVIMAVPASFQAALPTAPYYRSTYVFIARRDRSTPASLDDPRLRQLRIGVQVVGNDYDNPPAAQALARRNLSNNVRGFSVYGDYSEPEPQRAIIDAVAHGDVDTAIVWGPLAGFYVRDHAQRALVMAPVAPANDGRGLRFVFDIAMATRRDDRPLHDALNSVIARRRAEIQRILRAFGVPLV